MFGSRPGPLRRLSHTLFGLALLGTLWVTSLSNLSARPTATAILTDLGAQVLNPYLLTHTDGAFGIGQTQYAALELVAQAQPGQPLPLPGLKARVLGREIVGQPYTTGVRVIYSHVADAYYDGGAGAVFALPQQFTQVIDTYGVFALPSSSTTPGSSTQPSSSSAAPSLPQIPSFLKPFFFALGLSPTTLTAQGHAQIASILLWWWLAVIVFGLLAVILNGGSLQARQSRGRPEVVQRALTSLGSVGRPVEVVFDALTGGARRISGVGWATFSGALPGVLLIAVAWILTFYVYPQQLHPFAGALTVVTGAFLPVYGGGMIVGLIIAAAPWLVIGVLLLLGLLAGALLLLWPRRAAPAQPYVPSAHTLSSGYSGYSAPPTGYGAPTEYGPPNGYGPPARYGPPPGYGGIRTDRAGAYGETPDTPNGPGAPDAQTMPARPYYSPAPGSSERPTAPSYAPTYPQQHPSNYPPNYPPQYPSNYPPNYPPDYPPPGAPPQRRDG